MLENNTQDEEQQLNQGFLMYVAEVSQIPADDLEKLFYNGFDNPESIELCTIEDLQKLGVEDPEGTLTRLQMSAQYWKEEEPQKVEEPEKAAQ